MLRDRMLIVSANVEAGRLLKSGQNFKYNSKIQSFNSRIDLICRAFR